MTPRSWLTGLASAGLAAATILTIPASAPAAAGAGDVSVNIIGGTDATETYPYAVRLLTEYPGLGTGRCTGTLITAGGKVAVATNAHCVTDFDTAQPVPATQVTVQYGSTHLDQLTSVAAARIEVHPDWDWMTGNDPVADTAVIALPGGLNLTGIPLGTAADPGRPVRLLGWGRTTLDAAEPPPVLKQLDTRITGPSACATAGITAGEICVAARQGAAPCFGDSGGPALARNGRLWTLLGTASRETNDTCTGATIYTDTSHYASWITDAVTARQPYCPRRVAAGAAVRYSHTIS
ncbi:S1 family peptidase [Paractinoplanes hotanensis]|uniref:Trypsin-like serine protease n=1 Tax=Paractinoplanes hotanensis TaxID=2906497 RepID=A0ABT0Y846_9ACTN|nr:trypsin-like serine protease [Actinoplanes hotanensis]MCM4082214.1 trypsin-like serine protease [Actinoplanes hotanensis]